MELLATEYLQRTSRYMACEQQMFATEAQLLQALDQAVGRGMTRSVFLDSMGETLSSEKFAEHLGALRDRGAQRIFVAIGPADGWSAEARARADLLFSLGRITLPHGLARVVIAEQLYRAMTILSGHPYHSGH